MCTSGVIYCFVAFVRCRSAVLVEYSDVKENSWRAE